MNIKQFLLAAAALALCATTARALSFTPYHQFPQPAPFSYVVSGIALPDGTLLLWNGHTVFRQKFPNVDRYTAIASGYAGDTGFLALASDGHTAYLGAGFSGDIYRLDTNNPQNFTPAAIVANEPHFAGTLLTDDLLILDASTPDFSRTQLLILSLSNKKAGPATVVAKSNKYALPKSLVVEKPPFSYSSALTADHTNGILYAMDGNTRELRAFPIAALINAYNTANTLDWENDGTLIGAPGQFFSGGVAGITPQGRLLIGGSEGFLQPGGIHLIDPRLDDPSQAAILDTYDPAGTQAFYTVIYNPVTDVITAIDGTQAYASVAAFATVPTIGVGGLGLLAAALILLSARRFTRRPQDIQ